MENDQQLTDSGALKTLFFLKAINKYGFEHREQIKDILHWIDFDYYEEKAVWQEIETAIKSGPSSHDPPAL